MNIYKTVSVIGAGSWGTALANLMAPQADTVHLIARSEEMALAINDTRRNSKYLTDLALADNIIGSAEISTAISSEVIVFAVPTSAIRNTAAILRELKVDPSTILVSVAKGIERGSGMRMTEVLHDVLPDNPVAVISGPNHAEEVALNLPTCTTVGCADAEIGANLRELFSAPTFRSYSNEDLIGIEWGGAMKNIYAIAAGIISGLELGDNAIAALITRALAEMIRLGEAFGANPATFAGLSGVGDLMTTCYSKHSRNHRVGLALAQGLSVDQACEQLNMVAEGVRNTQSIYEQAKLKGIETPLIHAVYSVLYQGVSPETAIQSLFTRELKAE